MKKLKTIILCFSVLLLLIPGIVFADEDPESPLGQEDPSSWYLYGNTSELSLNFWNNYILLPYIESEGTQYINTGINGKSNLKVDFYVSNFTASNDTYYGIFGSSNGSIGLSARYRFSTNNVFTLNFNNQTVNTNMLFSNYNIINILFDKNKLYVNNQLIETFSDNSFDSGYNMYIFDRNNSGSNYNKGKFRLYYFSIYDYTEVNDQSIGLIRSYYPARSKSGSVVGLYDAVNDVFYPSASANAFSLPQGSDFELSLSARILAFITSSLSWSGSILGFAASNPMILFFMAIGLAGAMFRWARRLVNF